MDLKNVCFCLNNTGQIKSNLDSVAIVLVKYTSVPSDNIDINIDNEEKTISATIKEIQFDSAENFPEVGSERLIYVDKAQNMPYRWDSETKSYKSLGKDLSAEFKALEKKIEGISKETIKDIVVNNETSVGEDKIANINIQLQHDQSNSLLYYLMVNNKKAGEINIPKDQFLKSVSYNPDTHIITFVWVTTTGEQTTTINISDLIDVYVAGNGLELQDNVFSIKVDPTTDTALSVTSDGLKLNLSELKNEISDTYATKEFVEENGSKIDSISLNGKNQEIDANKNVDIAIPVASEINLGIVRAWVDAENYLCISTEEIAFYNYTENSILYINGSMDAQQQDGSLIIN